MELTSSKIRVGWYMAEAAAKVVVERLIDLLPTLYPDGKYPEGVRLIVGAENGEPVAIAWTDTHGITYDFHPSKGRGLNLTKFEQFLATDFLSQVKENFDRQRRMAERILQDCSDFMNSTASKK